VAVTRLREEGFTPSRQDAKKAQRAGRRSHIGIEQIALRAERNSRGAQRHFQILRI
jgi:hypothetical protein